MDALYIRRVLSGDVASFSYFIRMYKDMAYSIAFPITGNREDAEEVVQDAFLKAYQSLNSFREESRFSTWLYRIVVNLALNRVRRKRLDRPETELDRIPEQPGEDLAPAYLKLSKADQQKVIRQAMEQLNGDDRLMLTLYYLNELSLEEIAEITNLSRDVIKMRVHRARKKMFFILGTDPALNLQNLI
jgi:RNA polymerase sigma factor (sigma-70 family)